MRAEIIEQKLEEVIEFSSSEVLADFVSLVKECYLTGRGDELGLTDRISDVGYANMTSRECGSIGGFMVRRMINYAETHMPNVLEDHGKVTDLVPGEEFFFPDEDDE